MKVIIQIPCFNEEETLATTLSELPKSIDGVSVIETLVIDDGSSDKTVDVAEENGVNHILQIGSNKGLANAFIIGLEECLKLKADIIVNTDADNQYNAQDIQLLVQPILEGKADYIIGARPIQEIEHFSYIKKLFQNLGSWSVRLLSGLNITDAPSGFRAMSRDTAYKLNVFNHYTYTLETLIQAGHSNIRTMSVLVRVNAPTRPSRLISSTYDYMKQSTTTIFRFFLIYRAFSFLMTFAVLFFTSGFLLGARFLYLNMYLGETGHIQSVILSAALMTFGILIGVTAILADLISINRKLLEQIKYSLNKNAHDDEI